MQRPNLHYLCNAIANSTFSTMGGGIRIRHIRFVQQQKHSTNKNSPILEGVWVGLCKSANNKGHLISISKYQSIIFELRKKRAIKYIHNGVGRIQNICWETLARHGSSQTNNKAHTKTNHRIIFKKLNLKLLKFKCVNLSTVAI